MSQPKPNRQRSSLLKSALAHQVRLDILCCLDGTPLTIRQVSNRTDRDEKSVTYHLRVLDSVDLVGEKRRKTKTKNGKPLYASHLKKQPAWVARVVNAHRLAK